jgi:hypothetical protein
MNTTCKEHIEQICGNIVAFNWEEELESDEFIECHFGRREAPFCPDVISYITKKKNINDKSIIICICCKIYELLKKQKKIENESECKNLQMPYAMLFCKLCKGTKNIVEFWFRQDNVPGKDNYRIRKFLGDDLDIDWAENAEIHKFDEGKTIRLFKDENSAEIIIDEKKGKATLKISKGGTYNLKVKNENGKLIIYRYMK